MIIGEMLLFHRLISRTVRCAVQKTSAPMARLIHHIKGQLMRRFPLPPIAAGAYKPPAGNLSFCGKNRTLLLRLRFMVLHQIILISADCAMSCMGPFVHIPVFPQMGMRIIIGTESLRRVHRHFFIQNQKIRLINSGLPILILIKQISPGGKFLRIHGQSRPGTPYRHIQRAAQAA